MKVISDLQIHSKYSRAVSPKMVLPEIAKWAMIKRIDLMATGDWTHPLWFREIKSNLVEKSEGLYGLKGETIRTKGINSNIKEPLFLLSGEISSIYTQGGKSRRIHNLVFAPNIETVDNINKALIKRGANLMSDGRPIVGLSSIEICDIVFSIDEKCLVIPAHAWTPWFSLYGSKSGFDSIEECFGQYADKIYAIETGLSSDPAMNWRIKELENRSIISCSDAHSGPKIGREATVFEIEENLCYKSVTDAIKNNNSGSKIAYTIEFYPEEGKYHYTGHRSCNVKQDPSETRRLGTTCPVCGRPLTVGVMHRVDQIATYTEKELKVSKKGLFIKSEKFPQKPGYVMLVPLLEIIAESLDSAVTSQQCLEQYLNLCQNLEGEFSVLLKSSINDITKIAGEKIAQGVDKVRNGQIVIDPGYDGVFGVVKIWGKEEEIVKTDDSKKQLDLFS